MIGCRGHEVLHWGRAAIVFALLGFACGKDALVGGSCRQGFTECNLKCVDLRQDQAHCGTCGRACASGQTCSAGTCGGEGADAGDDGPSTDAAEGDVTLADGSAADISADGSRPDVVQGDAIIGDARPDDISGDAFTPDVPGGDVVFPDGRPGDGPSPDGPTCTPPYNTPERCGDCTTRCVEPAPLCGLQQGAFRCVARCDPPLVACGPACVNTASDERNCGTCGLACSSGICQAGACVGRGFGHEIVIGTDYSDDTLTESSAQVTMLGNAVFQSVVTTVRVLAYDEFADAPTVTRIESWLTTTATARGKSVSISKAPGWTALPPQLTVQQYQVLLVYDQARAAANQMATTGTLWNAAMSAFAKGGGIIVALDGGSAGRMRDFLTNGGLLEVTDETDVTGSQLNVDAPTDVVGQNLPNVFAARRTTVAFTTTQMRDNFHVFVVTDSTGLLPVVVHSVPRP